MQVHVSVCACVCGDQTSTLELFLSLPPPYFKAVFWLNLELTNSGGQVQDAEEARSERNPECLTEARPLKDSKTNWFMVNWQSHYPYGPDTRLMAKLGHPSMMGNLCQPIIFKRWDQVRVWLPGTQRKTGLQPRCTLSVAPSQHS